MTEGNPILIYCSCRMPVVGGMVECCNCSEWYHVPSCSSVSQAALNDTHTLWLCDKCSLLGNTPHALWNVPNCYSLSLCDKCSLLWSLPHFEMFLVVLHEQYTFILVEGYNGFMKSPNIPSNFQILVPWGSGYIKTSGPGIQIFGNIWTGGVHF